MTTAAPFYLTRPDVLLRLEGLLALISHIRFDRLLGFGLKFPGVFRDTHIQGAIDPGLKP
jgi:hypothetical protein